MEKYLSNCLESFIYDKQTNDIEVLIVNDGSKDNSINIANEYAKKYPNIFKVIDKENGGHGSTINAGLKVATGKYFKVVDSDDWVDTSNFRKLVEFLKQTSSDVVYNHYVKVFENSDKKKIVNVNTGKYDDVLNLHELQTINFLMAAATYKTELIKDTYLDEKCFYVDVEYNVYNYLKCKTITFLNYEVYMYRLGRVGQSVSVNGYYKHRFDHEKVMKRIAQIDTADNKAISYVKDLIKSHYVHYLSFYYIDKNTVSELLAFDQWLSNSRYYTSTNEYKFIRSLRKADFKNINRYAFRYKIKQFIKRLIGRD